VMPSEHSSPGSEFSISHLRTIAVRALRSAFERHAELAEHGLEEIRKNQFGDTALRMDIEAEEAVLESLRRDRIPVRVISEEHGIVDIGTPEFLAVLDGIDGTALYRKEPNQGRYGTMLGLYEGTDPLYADYIIGGIMQHATRKLLLGVRGQGAFAISDNGEKLIHTSKHARFDTDTKVYIDEYFETNRKSYSEPLSGFNTEYREASSLYYADVAEGSAAFALECTRKGNLEIAAAYGLIREAGGVTVDGGGSEIGQQKYLEFGQKTNLPVITAATKGLAGELIAFLGEWRRSSL
jgi:fructose-1,6-bisphosphatase/inositol monophosphatase family enzyme